jgi:RHS repeat-associated protein
VTQEYANTKEDNRSSVRPKQSQSQGQSGPEGGGEAKTESNPLPAVTLPIGGGALRGIDEKFSVNPATGTASISVPIFTSPGRQGFGPELSLNYDSGGGNGNFGLGWSLSIPSIKRKTAKGLPLYRDYEDSDTFVLSGAEDLVPVLDKNDARQKHDRGDYEMERYRPRTEGLFARIERWVHKDGGVHWRSVSKENITSIYGFSEKHRVVDPDDKDRVFQWLLEETFDARGNVVLYEYKQENDQNIASGQVFENGRKVGANRHIKRILYGNEEPAVGNQPPLPGEQKKPWKPYDRDDWLFEIVFDYGEHGTMATFGGPWNADPSVITDNIAISPKEDIPWGSRPDPHSRYVAGFEQRTHRLCRRVLMFHRMKKVDDHYDDPCLVRSTDFNYDRNEVATKLVGVTQTGYIRYKKNGELRYKQRSLPPIAYKYSKAEISSLPIDFDRESLRNLPQGVDGSIYRFFDLDGEGIPGILAEKGGTWYCTPNLGKGKLGPMQPVDPAPSLGNLAAGAQLIDLGGDGKQDCVTQGRGTEGYYERTDNGKWRSFRSFTSISNVDWQDTNLRLIDLTGDGLADVLISEHDVFVWYQSKGKEGYAPSEYVRKQFDEEKGPAVVFTDPTQSVFLADMSGDGLVDIARIRNGEVCYWPNLGYGRFGAKVTMGLLPQSGVFDYSYMYDPGRVRLGDIDGSGTTDILYLKGDRIDVYLNQSGNTLNKIDPITTLPGIDNLTSIDVVDVLGKGTACLVWSSSKPADAARPMKYVDLMVAGKPHLLVASCNNMGRENLFHYASSTEFYLEDKRNGMNWVTKLPFPVHVIERVETFDRVNRNRFVTRYAYRHGYFDGHEREFRGFGMVEQWDTEEIGALTKEGDFPTGDNIDKSSYVPPAHTKTWFHTGAYLEGDVISRLYENDYYREGDVSRGEWGLTDEQLQALLLDDTVLPDNLSAAEAREACRALRGSILRQEIYADDATDASDRPYSVSERNYTVKRLQGIGANKHGVFFTHPRETIDLHYERELVSDGDGMLADPRVSHQLTLAVDAFGNVEREFAVGYARRDLPGVEDPEQRETHVTLTVNRFANKDGQDDWYRVGMPVETRTFEIVNPPAPKTLDSIVVPYAFKDVEDLLEGIDDPAQPTEGLFPSDADHPADSTIWPYEKWDWRTNPANPPADTKLRLIEHVRTYYRSDNLDSQLGLGQVQSLALPYESYKLAFTPELLSDIYGDRVSLELLQTGGYVHSEGDDNWWIPSGRIYYAPDRNHTPPDEELDHARASFYLPHRFDDPFGNQTTVQYDDLKLLVRKTEDALQNTVRAEEDGRGKPTLDYRVLQPWLVTDPNGNRSKVAFDILGMVATTVVMGKTTEAKGDKLPSNPSFDPSKVDLERFSSNPRLEAAKFLDTASSRVLYDLWRYYAWSHDENSTLDDIEPVYAATIVRETHVLDLADGQESDLQVSFSYSDGFGREIQKKIQAEAGPLVDGGNNVPRWVGSGWTIFNNKGNPVRHYEPFFSGTHAYESEKKKGVSSTLFYDPLSRLVATLHPNHTYEKVVFTPWQQATWDVNDTINQSPSDDVDVKAFLLNPDGTPRLPAEEYLPTWKTENSNSTNPARRSAALKVAAHADTPQLTCFDSLGRPFLTIDDNGTDQDGAAQKYVTRVVLDLEGNQRQVTDAKDRAVMRYDYDMLSTQARQASMDAGKRWLFDDVMGKPFSAWDSKQHHVRYEYDELRRKTKTLLSEAGGNEELVEEISYGEQQGPAKNHRTRVLQVNDQAGIVTNAAYDFKGNLEVSLRELSSNYKTRLDWNTNPALEIKKFTSTARFDALNRPISLVQPDKGNSEILTFYNEAGLIDSVSVKIGGQAQPKIIVKNIKYNARGQRTRIGHGNDVITEYAYEKETFRLLELTTTRDASHPPDKRRVQGLQYAYDPIGNITSICDDAQQSVYFKRQVTKPKCDYTYDPLYRLVKATGREHIGQVGKPQTTWNDEDRANRAHPHDGQKMRPYAEDFVYDEVGNIISLIHRAAQGDWTRGYTYSEPSLLDAWKKNNLLTSTKVGAEISPHTYDEHGSMESMPHLPGGMAWDFRDQLARTSRQVVNNGGTPETTYYVYDSAGQRVRKVTEWSAPVDQDSLKKQERIYIGPFEAFLKYDNNGDQKLERQTLTIMAGDEIVALIDRRAQGSDKYIRYQYTNHLGSACLELDNEAKVITYEEYYPYGGTSYQAVLKNIEVPLKRIRYMGKERDEESGFYYFGARFYAPWICRWVGADPSGTDDGTNPYCFVQCNPIRFIDIDGLFSWDPAAWGDALEAKITELEKSSLMEDKHVGTSLWNTLVATSATVAKGSTSILKVGTGAAQGVEDIKRGMREEGDAWDIAIGTARILSDAGEVAGAAAGAAGGVAKAGAAVKVATKARRASALRRQAQQMSKSSSQFRSTAEQNWRT